MSQKIHLFFKKLKFIKIIIKQKCSIDIMKNKNVAEIPGSLILYFVHFNDYLLRIKSTLFSPYSMRVTFPIRKKVFL